MKFSDFEYKRPVYEDVKVEFLYIVGEIENSSTYKEQKEKIDKLNVLRNTVETMSTIASIRYTINTRDEFYEKEREYWDEYSPLYDELNSNFYKVIVSSNFKEDIIKDFGEQFFNIASYSLKSFSPKIIKDLQEENRLCSQYTKLMAGAKINYKGEVYNLSKLGKYMLGKDREERRTSSEAYYGYFKDNQEKFEELFDKLVKIRTNIANKLGFEDFVELGYIRMMRTDYNEKMVEKFREQVLEYIVPLANKIYKRQAERLNLEKLTYIDENFEFLSGNATPKCSSREIIENGKKMYKELSSETSEFFNFMLENELMDLVTKEGKGAGGYCTYIPNYKSPFIFSNFNQTADDIDVLTHEAGHAFQLYMSRDIDMPEINFPTYESCEIHSMSMEFITWPWMELFFKEDSEKYRFIHMSSAIKFIPYGIVVDEFQHYVYKQPDLSKEERRNVWRNLEKKYLPHKDYSGCEFLENGGWWFKQGHIFKNPFYYVDYTLAQICALQFWKKIREDKKGGWDDYINICKVGGRKSFLEIVKIGNLKSPFEEGCVSSVIDNIDGWLMSIDDKNM
ncbi:M3 family oligoendopeptidase [Asaccharospora irregularis]|uniref:Oligoendopeptidase, M3 family n=1 Tax=Asaccharospora irregularis DSM 2635 TaxID=1121321 RepID=A0A1M5MV01_9FIRM|nr:M3 family oligoendopeptidase [Asaccharospora irregularis]SHG81118.1 oligoendopeptidase, M3 family [Asaccharospora irregularis DSM 2635]